MNSPRLHARLAAGVFIFGFLLAGCSAPQTRLLLTATTQRLPMRVELDTVPFYPQEQYQCGPAALATVLNQAGSNVTPDELAAEVFLPAREGSLTVEMAAATRQRALVAYQIAPTIDALLAEVAAGTPVVVLQNLALPWVPRWHYAVVIGYDRTERTIILRSGTRRRVEYSLATFEHTWKRSRYWGMLAIPPTRLPQSASEQSYIDAVIALEKVKRFESAQLGYRTALRHWPNNVTAWIGLGNSAYALGELAAAETAFRRATQLVPSSAVGWNNLAELLARQGKLEEALTYAEKAVSLGGPHRPAAQQTLAEIRNLLGQPRQ